MALHRGQRMAVLVGLGAAALAVDQALTGPAGGGWFGYAPNTSVLYSPGSGLGSIALLGVRLVLVGAWTATAIVLLRERREP